MRCLETELLVLLTIGTASYVTGRESYAQMCVDPQQDVYSYESVMHPSRDTSITFQDLPGFTRSVYRKDYALITPESRVWTSLPGWVNGSTAHMISGASGADFSMYLAKLGAGGEAPQQPPGIERFIFVLEGSAYIGADDENTELKDNSFAYMPPFFNYRMLSTNGVGFLVYEHRYRSAHVIHDDTSAENAGPYFVHGITDEQPIVPAPGEVFILRKLLPQTTQFNFNIHIMDFKPGEHLFVKEVHYNQHGLMLLQGNGIYRLANDWYPVQSGDAIWMAPYVVQWYAALGKENSRYIIFKDTLPPDM